MYCTQCGTQLQDNSNFCNNCGHKLTASSQTTGMVKRKILPPILIVGVLGIVILAIGLYWGGSANRSVVIAEEDFTSDGTKDIRLYNKHIYVQLDGEDLGTKGSRGRIALLSHAGILNRDNSGKQSDKFRDLTGKVTTRPVSDIKTNGNLGPEFRSTERFAIVSNNKSVGAFRVNRKYYTFGESEDDRIPLQIGTTVQLEQGHNYASVQITFQNEGEKKFTFDTDPGHIHDGTKLLTKLDLLRAGDKYRFHLAGQGTGYIRNQSQWQTYRPTSWMTMYDSQLAVSYGVTAGPTSGKMWIIGGEGRMTHFRQELTIAPGDSVTYKTFVGPHGGGSAAPDTGQEIFTKAADNN